MCRHNRLSSVCYCWRMLLLNPLLSWSSHVFELLSVIVNLACIYLGPSFGYSMLLLISSSLDISRWEFNRIGIVLTLCSRSSSSYRIWVHIWLRIFYIILLLLLPNIGRGHFIHRDNCYMEINWIKMLVFLKILTTSIISSGRQGWIDFWVLLLSVCTILLMWVYHHLTVALHLLLISPATVHLLGRISVAHILTSWWISRDTPNL